MLSRSWPAGARRASRGLATSALLVAIVPGPLHAAVPPPDEPPSTPSVWAAIRILRVAAGISPALGGNPNFQTPRSAQDLATMDMDGDGRLTVCDAALSLTLPAWGGWGDAVWSMDFTGSTANVRDGRAANATAMPAAADVTGDGIPDLVFAMGAINGGNYADPRVLDIGGAKSSNTNNVYVLTAHGGAFHIAAGWPQPLRDAPKGVTVAALDPLCPTPAILAANFQDSFSRNGVPFPYALARAYVWTSGGGPFGLFANADNPDSPHPGEPLNPMAGIGVVNGHTNTAPSVFSLDGEGPPEIFFTAEGLTGPGGRVHYGGFVAWSADGSARVRTQSLDPAAPWYLGPYDAGAGRPPVTEAEARLEAPVVPMRRAGRPDPAVVAATDTGQVYAWDRDGRPMPGFRPMRSAPPGSPATTEMVPGRTYRETIISPIATADLFANGASQILVASGSPYNYAHDGYNDGAVYCFSETGRRMWRYPARGVAPGFGSGVSVGRVLAGSSAPAVVVGDAEGRVLALDRVDGHVHWSYQVEKYPGLPYPRNLSHQPYFRAVSTQPLIADINADGVQDVLIGTMDGEVYALTHEPGTDQARVLPGFPLRSCAAPQTHWQGVTETHGESIIGLALAAADPARPDHAFLLVTTGRAAVTNPNPIGGHATLFDLGPGSWNPTAADWPQHQQNEQRAGSYPGP